MPVPQVTPRQESGLPGQRHPSRCRTRRDDPTCGRTGPKGVAPVARKAARAAPARAARDAPARRPAARRVPRRCRRVRARRSRARATYEAGDDSRWIDWNLTARSIAPQVRTTEADRELQTWIVVDRSASMNFGTAEREKSDVAFAAAAAFGFLTARHGNRFGMLVAGGDTRRAARSDLDPSRAPRVAVAAATTSPRRDDAPADGADLAAALVALERARPRRGQIIVISDFLDDSRLGHAVRRLALAHQVLCVQIVDPRELALPAVGMLVVRRHRDRSPTPRAVELAGAPRAATPPRRGSATKRSPAASATRAASTSCSSPTPTG